jgi:hypothetical protein
MSERLPLACGADTEMGVAKQIGAERDPLGTARGFLVAILLAVFLWVAVLMVFF